MAWSYGKLCNKHILLFLITLLLTPFTSAQSCQETAADAGSVDLQCLNHDAFLLLNGGWQLQFDALNTDYQFNGVAPVPKSWRDLPDNPDKLSKGKGTYQLTLINPPQDQQLSFLLPRIFAARDVRIQHPDGSEKILLQAGDVNDKNNFLWTPVKHYPLLLPHIESGAKLIVTLGSYATHFSGFRQAPILAHAAPLYHKQFTKKLATAATATLLVLFAMVNLFLWGTKTQNKVVVLLAIAAMCISIRQINNAGLIYDLLPNLSVALDAYAHWMSFLVGTITAVSYIYTLHPERVPMWLMRTIIGVPTVAIVVLLYGGIDAIESIANFLSPVIVMFCIIFLVFQFLNYSIGSVDNTLTLGSLMLIVVCLTFDVIHYHLYGVDLMIPLVSLAWIVFIATQTYLLSHRYALTFRKNLQLNNELTELNINLEHRISERTTELARKNEELEIMSKTDSLTGLANRREVRNFVEGEFNRMKRRYSVLSAVLLDVDFFKQVNDQYGHLAGDMVLKNIACLLEKSVRKVDLVARWGGEEFCIIFPCLDQHEAYQVMERIRKAISHISTEIDDSRAIQVTASAGIATTNEVIPFDELLHFADVALYEAKELGRNQIRLSQGVTASPTAQMELV
jgi:diguanylate cyclase (GGDEF)-like protein